MSESTLRASLDRILMVTSLWLGDTWCEREGPVAEDPALYHSGSPALRSVFEHDPDAR